MKYKELKDEELISLFKNANDLEAENELLKRYRIHSMKLAGEIYQGYSNSCNIEFDDLVSIGLFSYLTALKKFKNYHSFFKYWQKVAYYEMMSEIKSLSLSFVLQDNNAKVLGFDETVHYKLLEDDVNQQEKDKKRKIVFDEACRELTRENSPLDPLAIDVFLLYLDGYNFKEISEKLSLKYCAVRRILGQVVDTLKSLLSKK